MSRVESGKRSPLKQRSLRLPGQSVEDERDRLFDEKAMPIATVMAFAVALAGMEWWRWLTKSPVSPVLFTVVAVAVAGFGTYRLSRIRGRLKDLKLGAEGERVVGQFLEANREADWHILHDIPGPGFNVDHVIVSPQGVYAIETKTFSKPSKGESVVKYNGAGVLVNGFEPDRNPVVQAKAVSSWLQDLLFDMTGIRYPVRGVVLFPGWYVESPRAGTRPDVWVLNEKAFVKFVKNERQLVKSEDVALAANRLVTFVTRDPQSV